ncbi:MAG: hypothetical protein HY006_00085 [Candidatus Sungbacteria bacterium]|nr:hypothetical protein [Candidatus Sungbacteria bacterium]
MNLQTFYQETSEELIATASMDTGFFLLHRQGQASILGEPRRFSDPWHKERETIVAELCVELIAKYGYASTLLEPDATLALETKNGMQYHNVDLLVRNEDGAPILMFAVVPPAEYDQSREQVIGGLFRIAENLSAREQLPLFLVYYTQWHQAEATRIRTQVIMYPQFATYEAWKSTGAPYSTTIPHKKEIL